MITHGHKAGVNLKYTHLSITVWQFENLHILTEVTVEIIYDITFAEHKGNRHAHILLELGMAHIKYTFFILWDGSLLIYRKPILFICYMQKTPSCIHLTNCLCIWWLLTEAPNKTFWSGTTKVLRCTVRKKVRQCDRIWVVLQMRH